MKQISVLNTICLIEDQNILLDQYHLMVLEQQAYKKSV